MHDQNQPNHPPNEPTQRFWQAWREQEGTTPRLAHRLLQRGRQLRERCQDFRMSLSILLRPAQVRGQGKLGAALAVVALTLALSSAPVAQAMPIAFEAQINGSDCLLVDAITAANTDTATGDCNAGNPGTDTIELLDNVTLFTAIGTAGLPEVNSAITLNGNGFTIAGIDDAFGIIRVVSGGDLTLNNTTITAGFGIFGGVYNAGTLTLNHSTVTGNSTLAAQTGGIMNYGVATLNYSTVSNNGDGGIDNAGTLTLNNSTVSGNTGPGITNGNMLTLSNSTVSGNTGYFGGGGINNAGTLTVSDSTVSGNSAFNSGGGIYNSGALTLERSLIAGNTAINGQEVFSAGCLSAASANTPDCLTSASSVNSADSNLFGHSGLTNGQAFSGFTPDGDDITATSDGTTPTALAAILGTTLQVNAPGNTATHALMTSSPAVDAASSGPATDQRGVSRPQGTAFDIGAFELEQAAAPANARINGTDCDLIDAITAANTDTATGACAAGTPGADTIDLLDNVTLTSAIGTVGTPPITSIITLNGNGFTIARDAGAPDFGILAIAAGGDLTLNATTITGGSFFPGAGINNALGGTLTLNNSTVSGNNADSGGNRGGGIVNSGTATLNNSTVSGNSAQFAGGIDNDGGVLTLINSTIRGNSALIGGGLATTTNPNGNVTLNNSTVSENTATLDNAGVYVTAGTVTLNNSTVSGNIGRGLGLSFASPTVILNNSTVSGNTDGGIRNASPNGTLTLNNSIVANQVAGGDCVGPITSAGYNLDSDGSCGLTGAGDIPSGLADLGPLQVNAPGNTATHALLTGSQAIDGGNCSGGTLTLDQRGVTRPQGPACDIGAFELEQASNQPPTVATNNAGVTVDEGQLAANTGTVSDPDGDTVAMSASVGAVVNNNDGTWSWTLVTTDGPADSQTVTISADDDKGGVSTTTFDLTVNNVAPTINSVSNNGPITAGGAANITVAATDPAGAADPLAYEFDCDNNGGYEVGPQAGSSTACTFAGPGSFPVNVRVSDDDGGEAIGSTVVTVSPANTPVGSCGGYAVTQTPGGSYIAPGWSGNIIVGHNGWNIIFGSNNADLILGLGGPDDIFGLGGDDVICGGDGIDIIAGGGGNDILYGDNHPDWLIGGEGNDTLYGGEGWDDLEGNSGNDVVYGEAGFDVLLGGSHNDTLDGGEGPDYLEGGSGADTMSGGADADALYGGHDNDTLAGNDGNDLLYGNNGSDTLDGGANNDFCKGGAGNDTIANCEGASSATIDDDAANDKAGEADPLKLNDDNGANAIEQRVNQIFLPLVTK